MEEQEARPKKELKSSSRRRRKSPPKAKKKASLGGGMIMAMSDTPAKDPVYFHQQRLDATALPDLIPSPAEPPDVIRQAELMLQSSLETPAEPRDATPEE